LPDINVWLALSWANHMHSATAWSWISKQDNSSLYFCRFTQLGLLRLLTTASIMGEDVCTTGQAWKVYDRWLDDSRTGIRHESFDFDNMFRTACRSVWNSASPKALADRYLLAVSQSIDATLVTFDRGLASICQNVRQPVMLLKTTPV